MKVLFIASEAFPFIKSGGLGDVIFSLPRELRRLGIDARVMIPKYGDIPSFFREKMSCVSIFNVPVGWRNQYCGVEEIKYEGMPFYFIDNEYYFKRQGMYGFYDEAERYAFFCRAALEAIRYLDFKPDILHCHDWQTGMANLLLKAHYDSDAAYNGIKTVFTIHNLQYQGIFPKEVLGELLDLGDDYFNVDAVEFFGGISFTKGGINYSDVITTVSDTYREEIQTPFFGEQLDDLLRMKREGLFGIVNGIDYSSFDPKTDKGIFVKYDSKNIKNKALNKTKLQEQLKLPVNKDIPMLALVSTLTRQKGLDLIANVLDGILAMDVQLVVLGQGDNNYETLFRNYENNYPDKFSASITYDDVLARKIFAASDFYLKPSLFEPCGVGQLIALRYGCIPIVRETGGLKDTVKAYNDSTGEGNGFSFSQYTPQHLLGAIKKALEYYKGDSWLQIAKNAMKEDYSWKRTAMAYKKLYQSIT
ncbi:MAG TPA: glycogen synthase GlgA [Clostridia bacterium]|nr:glycogen synthase GlgA [Clostridia bacterium]